jgi:hypothetical protein
MVGMVYIGNCLGIPVYLLRYLHERNIPMAEKTSANIPKTVKSIISFDIFIGLRKINRLEASVAYDTGLTFATACNQLGMMDVGNSALLAKRSGRFNRFITAI